MRRRRRNPRTIDKFVMFKNSVPTNGKVPHRNESMGSSTGGSDVDVEMFGRMIRETPRLLEQFNGDRNQLPFIRCKGGKKLKQKYVPVAIVRLKQNHEGGGRRLSVIIFLIIEQESKRVRNLVVRAERTTNDANETIDSSEICNRSCDMMLSGVEISTRLL